MTTNQIKYFISLKRFVKHEKYIYASLLILFVGYSHFDRAKYMAESLPTPLHMFIFVYLSYQLFGKTSDAKSCEIIEDLISRDAELIRSVNEHRKKIP